jgi:hypothetical protein
MGPQRADQVQSYVNEADEFIVMSAIYSLHFLVVHYGDSVISAVFWVKSLVNCIKISFEKPGNLIEWAKRYNPLSMGRTRIIAYLEVTFAVIVWGASFIATKLALRDLSPVTVVWLRFAIGVLILGIVTAIRHHHFRQEWIFARDF